MRRGYTFAMMRWTLEEGWGDLGSRVAECWRDYNSLYFGGRLRPLPISLTPTMPYGRCIAYTAAGGPVRHIALSAPAVGTVLVAERETLLHEMVHQRLSEEGRDPHHDGQPWCDEIMRIHHLLTGQ